MNRLIANFITLFFTILILSAQQVQAVPGDYDGDGFADLAIIDADEPESKTTVFVRKSSNGKVVPFVFHPFGDDIISGNFYGNGRTYPGIVYAVRSGGSKPLEWRIKNTAGKENIFRFGVKGDVVPNQGDLDCDGTTDYVVTRNESNGTKTWFAKFSTSPDSTQTTSFGSSGDLPFTADTDNDGCDEIVTLTSSYVWTSRDFSGVNTITTQAGLPGDIPLTPVDIDNDNNIDYITVRIEGSRQVAHIHAFGTETTKALGTDNSIPMIGNFFGDLSFGWFQRSKGRFFLVKLDQSESKISFGNPRRGLVRPDGTVVTEEEDGRFSSSNSGSNSGSGSDDSSIVCSKYLKKDGSGGFKNNPENSKNTIKIIFPNSMTGKIENAYIYSGDTKIDTLKHKVGNEWGNRERYYGTKPLGSYPKNLLLVANMEDGSNICAEIPDAKKVLD